MYIEVKNLSHNFGNYQALKNISFEIEKGDLVVIIGPNGSGKTTLLKNMIGILKPSSGEVLINKTSPKLLLGKIGYVPQHFDFDRSVPITVFEFMDLERCKNHKHGSQNISKVLVMVGLHNIENEKLGSLSGGQFQRVMIARALLHEKEILIFDEPSTGIDVIGEKTVYDLIAKINKERGTTCIIVSHELNIVNKYAKKVICLNREMVCIGAPEKTITPETLKKLYGSEAGLYHSH